MSTFRGLLVDYPLRFIAIDHFGTHTYDCDVFLLSHHHCDHMSGFYSDEFVSLINQSENKFIYCSPVTAHFLRTSYKLRNIKNKINALDIYKPLVIEHDFVKTDVVITCLPAGHCPGSVMFLLEYEGRRILYSGDIRMTEHDLKKIRGGLTNADGSLIPIDDLYLDTTWAVPSRFNDMPTREDSENTIIDIISESVLSCDDTKVHLFVPSKFGYESLYLRIFKKFKVPVMIHDFDFKYYCNVEEMKYCIIPSSSSYKWLVHACTKSSCNILTKNVKIIRPCAMTFVRDNITKFEFHKVFKVPYHNSSTITRVMYSCHSSLNELRGIYKFLKPKMMYPSVQMKDFTLSEINSAIMTTDMSSENESIYKIKRGLCAKPSNPSKSREENERHRIEIEKKLKLLY